MFGGIGTYARELAQEQAKRGHRVYLVFMDNIIEVNVGKKQHLPLKNSSYRIVKGLYDALPVTFRNKLKLEKMKSMMRKGKAIFGDDFVGHIHFTVLAEPFKKIWPNNRLTQTVHGYYALESLSDNDLKKESKRYKSYLEIEKYSYDRSSVSIAVDTRIYEHIKSISPTAKVVQRPNFVDDSKFTPVANEGVKNSLKNKLNIPNDSIVLLTTRRFERKNGIPILADALVKLKETVKRKICVLIAGHGSEFDQVRDTLSYFDGDARLLGPVSHDEILQLYQVSDIFVLPSISVDGVEEATSISVLEAMSCANVILASGIGGIKQLIQSGSNGILVKDNDSEILAESIETLIDDFKNKKYLGEAARQTVIKSYGVKDYADFTDLCYSGL